MSAGAALAVCALILFKIFSPPPARIEPKAFGGEKYDSARAIIKEKNGFVIAGMTGSKGAGHIDAYLAFLDKNGDIRKDTTFGGRGDDRCLDMVKAGDGYFLGGFTTSYGKGGRDMYVVKTDSNGNMLFTKVFGGKGMDEAACLVPLPGGAVLAAGTTSGKEGDSMDIYAVRIDKNGGTVWEKTYGSVEIERGSAALRAYDGGFLIAGTTMYKTTGLQDIFMVKTGPAGEKQWKKRIGAKGIQRPFSMIKDNEGGYLIAAETGEDDEKGSDIQLIKTDERGEVAWDKRYGGRRDERPARLIKAAGGYIIAGRTYSMGNGMSDVYLIKTDESGELLWERVYGERKDEYPGGITQCEDGGVAFAGWTGSFGKKYQIYFFKTGKNGFAY